MKTSLSLLLLALTTAASATPLPSSASLAIGAGVSAANQRPVLTAPSLSPAMPSLRPTIVVPVAPRPICVLPVPVQAARPAPRPQVSR